jgi:glutathione synthase/RimK-type ligase-like ATP-grasp enzyme
MKTGQYILDRYLPDFIRESADRQSITCSSMSDDWVLRLERGPDIRWILGYQFDINNAAASALAQDKVATHLHLRESGIPSVEHLLVRSVPHEMLMKDILKNRFSNNEFVIKPLDGTGGRGVMKVASVDQAIHVIDTSGETAWAASPYYEISNEYRLILLNDEILMTYEKTQPVELHGMRFYNLGLGAQAVDITDHELLRELYMITRSVCASASLRLAAVDIVRTVDGELLVLEINDGIMMENYARQNVVYKKRAASVYDRIVTAMFT